MTRRCFDHSSSSSSLARSTVFDMELEEAKPKEEKVISCPVLSDEDEVIKSFSLFFISKTFFVR